VVSQSSGDTQFEPEQDVTFCVPLGGAVSLPFVSFRIIDSRII